MNITKVHVENYRNLDGIQITLNPDFSCFVGENDLGKSNLLDMLNTLFNGWRFVEDDFSDVNKPIKIEFSLKLRDEEIGVFDDYFDPTSHDALNVLAVQDSPDDNIQFFHRESGEGIYPGKFRSANFIKYDSLRSPHDELTFHRGRGVGKFLAYLIDKSLSANPIGECLNKDSVKPAVDYVNKVFKKIKMFEEFGINASIEESLSDLVYRILSITDAKGFDVQKMGYGVQFSVLVVLTILDQLMRLVEEKKRQEYIFEHNGEKSISLILGLDEPEIHLHPYMQRALVRYIENLLNNEEEDFSLLIKEVFGIDKINGQALIATHSPSLISNSYKRVNRFYRTGARVDVVSGEDISLGTGIEKHLLRNFPYIKEAFFSRCVIIVEGDTESGALPVWGEEMHGELDKHGIAVISGGGGRSIPPIAQLLNRFKISNCSIVDRDIYGGSQTTYNAIANLHVTDKRDFEEELVDTLQAAGKTQLLFDIVKDYEANGLDRQIQKNKLVQIAGRYNLDATLIQGDCTLATLTAASDKNLLKIVFLSWLDLQKSITLGRLIGEKVEAAIIPVPYFAVMMEAKALASNP